VKPVVKSLQVNSKLGAFPVQSSLKHVFFDIAFRVFIVTGLSTAEWAASSFIMLQHCSVVYGEQSGERNTMCILCAKIQH
jgi:hypothetical protein